MVPRSLATPKTLQHRKAAVEHGFTTSHWPTKADPDETGYHALMSESESTRMRLLTSAHDTVDPDAMTEDERRLV